MFTLKHYINIISLFFIGLIGSIYLFWFSGYFHLNPFLITVLALILFWGCAVIIGNHFIKPRKKNSIKFSNISLSVVALLTFFTMIVIIISDYVEFYLPAEFYVSSVLTIGLCFLSLNYVPADKINFFFFAAAFLSGIILFLRSVETIPFIIFIIYYFRNRLAAAFLFLLSSVITFLILLFLLKEGASQIFLIRDPFIIKSFLLDKPWWIISIVIFFTFYAGYSSADLQEVFFLSGILLAIPAFYGFILKCFSTNLHEAITGADNTNYFLIFSLPFFILSIKYYQVDRYLGKIIPAE